jgi:hypothetical protein
MEPWVGMLGDDDAQPRVKRLKKEYRVLSERPRSSTLEVGISQYIG